jgi:hypothetical protein
MFRYPIVEEIRQIRHEIEEECHNDSEEFYAYLLENQKQYTDRLVRRQPKPAISFSSSTLLQNADNIEAVEKNIWQRREEAFCHAV